MGFQYEGLSTGLPLYHLLLRETVLTCNVPRLTVDVPNPGQALTYNRPVNHVGLSVTDLEGAIEWYTKHLGFRHVGKILEFDRSVNPEFGGFRVYGDRLNKGRFTWLVSGNGVGVELFNFDDPKQEEIHEPFQFHKSGFFHLCLTDHDPIGTLERLQKVGATAIGEPFDLWGNGETYCVYLADPWGHVIELLNIGYEEHAVRLGGVRKY